MKVFGPIIVAAWLILAALILLDPDNAVHAIGEFVCFILLLPVFGLFLMLFAIVLGAILGAVCWPLVKVFKWLRDGKDFMP